MKKTFLILVLFAIPSYKGHASRLKSLSRLDKSIGGLDDSRDHRGDLDSTRGSDSSSQDSPYEKRLSMFGSHKDSPANRQEAEGKSWFAKM